MKSPLTLISLALVSAVWLSGCAAPAPSPVENTHFRDRVLHQQDGEVHVAVSVLGAKESEAEFGVPLASKGIQPVWLEVKNGSSDEFVLMLFGIDSDYFSPSEVAWQMRSPELPFELDGLRLFVDAQMPVTMPPQSSRSGFVFTAVDPGAKALVVELVGELDTRSLEFVVPIPGFAADIHQVDLEGHYRPEEIRALDLDGLRDYLATLPCCVKGGDRKTPGDPLNLVVLSDGLQSLTTFIRQGWDLTETVRWDTAWRTVMSSVFGANYRTSPVSPLYLFDRPQDIALQKTRQSVDERNHLRMWLAPVTYQGLNVWVGQISRDIGVKLTSKTIVTHKVDPMVDEARTYIMMDLVRSQYVGRVAYVKGVGAATLDSPRFNYTNDPYYTDGLRVVLFLAEEPHNYQEIEWLEWAEYTY